LELGVDAYRGVAYGPLVVFASETGLRTNEWVALERRDVDKAARVVTVQRRFADGMLTNYPKTERSRRSVPLTERALAAYERVPARLATRLVPSHSRQASRSSSSPA
jgi:integrase